MSRSLTVSTSEAGGFSISSLFSSLNVLCLLEVFNASTSSSYTQPLSSLEPSLLAFSKVVFTASFSAANSLYGMCGLKFITELDGSSQTMSPLGATDELEVLVGSTFWSTRKSFRSRPISYHLGMRECFAKTEAKGRYTCQWQSLNQISKSYRQNFAMPQLTVPKAAITAWSSLAFYRWKPRRETALLLDWKLYLRVNREQQYYHSDLRTHAAALYDAVTLSPSVLWNNSTIPTPSWWNDAINLWLICNFLQWS